MRSDDEDGQGDPARWAGSSVRSRSMPSSVVVKVARVDAAADCALTSAFAALTQAVVPTTLRTEFRQVPAGFLTSPSERLKTRVPADAMRIGHEEDDRAAHASCVLGSA